MTEDAARPLPPLAPRTLAALAALVVLVIAVASITPEPIGVFWDDGVYLLTAKALASGAGYRYSFLPGTPPAIHYPPGFPLLLAAVLKVTPAFPANVTVLKLLNPCFAALGVYGTLRLAARVQGLDGRIVALVAVIFAGIAPVLALSNSLMSEALFFAILTGTLGAAEDVVAFGGMRRALAAGVWCALLTLVRTIGGVIIPAAAIVLWHRGRRREGAALFATAVLLLVPWQLWVWTAARGFPDELRGNFGPYLDWMLHGYRTEPGLLLRVASLNLASVWKVMGIVFAPLLPSLLKHVAAVLLVFGLVAGSARLWRRLPVLVLFLLAYGIVVLFWPYNPERFAWAVWPLAGLVLVAALIDDREQPRPDWLPSRSVMTLGIALLMVGHVTYAVRGLRHGWSGAAQRAVTARLWPLVEWSAANTREGDLIASDGNIIVSLYTGRMTVPVSLLTTAEYVRDKPAAQLAAELTAIDARYHPGVLLLSGLAQDREWISRFARQSGAPAVVALPAVVDGGAAFALRHHRE